jgi:hypothetical protein
MHAQLQNLVSGIKTPSTKLQAPEKIQAPSSKLLAARRVLPLTLGLACLLTGCFSKEKIPFSDGPQMDARQAVAVPVTEPAGPKLATADTLLVETAVYGYLLQHDDWATNGYTAVFLQGEDSEVALLQKLYPRHDPPIKSADRAVLQPNHAPTDKDTGRPAIILSVETADPAGDTVGAVGRWYAGDAVAGSSQFELKKMGSNWEIQSVK